MTNSIKEIRDADCIFTTGSNTAEAHPVIGYEVIRAVKRGANLVIVDPRRIPLTDHATLFLQIRPGTDMALAVGMMFHSERLSVGLLTPPFYPPHMRNRSERDDHFTSCNSTMKCNCALGGMTGGIPPGP